MVTDLFFAISIGLPLRSFKIIDALFKWSVTPSPITTIRLLLVVPETSISTSSSVILYTCALNPLPVVGFNAPPALVTVKSASAANAAVGSSVKHSASTRNKLPIRFFMVCPPLYGGQVLFMPAWPQRAKSTGHREVSSRVYTRDEGRAPHHKFFASYWFIVIISATSQNVNRSKVWGWIKFLNMLLAFTFYNIQPFLFPCIRVDQQGWLPQRKGIGHS